MTRNEFLRSMGSAAFMAASGCVVAMDDAKDRYQVLQTLIDQVKASQYREYMKRSGSIKSIECPTFERLEQVFDRIKMEVRDTVVTDRPAVWFLYNMGVIVKTAKACFAIDVMHRRAHELAPMLDFAMITHNHDDHCSEQFYRAMDRAQKTVISNFKDNYGAHKGKNVGGYTRSEKTFKIKDVEITTSLTDHNHYLVDFTTAFEVRIGDFVIYHSGDCCNASKLHPKCKNPDLWFVHPRCGMAVVDGAKSVNPKRTVVVHLNELGHDKWRWSWKDGFVCKTTLEASGYAAIVPIWGDRIV